MAKYVVDGYVATGYVEDGAVDVSLTAGAGSLSLAGQVATITTIENIGLIAGSGALSLTGQVAAWAQYTGDGIVPYNAAKKWLIDTFDLDSDVWTAVLLKGSYTPAATHDTWSDISAQESSGYTQQALAGLIVSQAAGVAMWDGNDLTFGPSITTTAAYVAIVQGTAGALIGTDKLFGYASLRSDESEVTVRGNSLDVAWSANGIWRAA